MDRTKGRLICGIVLVATAVVCLARYGLGAQAIQGYTPSQLPKAGAPFWWAQIDYTRRGGAPWDASDFAALAQSGMNGVEVNLDWADIEPQQGRYDFKLLDRYMAEAAKAHLKIYLLFWESVWGQKQGKNPAPWITARDVSSDGVPALEPPWWDEASRQAYFDYVARTIDHVKSSPGFGGVYAAYGWLDSEWGPAPKGSHGVTGYAPADIKAFYRWLPQTYKTLANFNHQWHTSYRAWKDVPVGRPGDSLFALYQRFRQYSAEEGFGAVTRLVREHTHGTVLYSWGGGIDGHIGPEVQGNDPDMFFRLAKKYHVVVNLDDSNTAGLALVFGGLVRSYRSAMINEWTPWRKDLHAEIPEWLGHMGLNAPFAVGANFFIYPPPPQRAGFLDGWKAYQEWHEILTNVIRGTAPVQPVAVIVPLRKISLSTDLNIYPNLTPELGDFWEHHHVLPYLISDDQVARGMVSLQKFHAVVDLGDEAATLPAFKRYSEKHPVLKTLDQALSYLRPYVTLDPAYDSLEVTPTVEGSSVVWLMLGNCNAEQGYSGTISFDPAALGLRPAGSFSLKDAQTGRPISATRSKDGKIQWRVNLPSAAFQVVQLRLGNAAER